MNKHTPGPWRVSQQRGLSLFIVGCDEAIAEILRVEQNGGFDGTLFANGRLIAAAPELLEALEHAFLVLLEDPTIGNNVDYNDVRSQCEAAIRKARGEI